MTDLLMSQVDDESWCSTHTTVNAVSGGGLVSGDKRTCVFGDDVSYEFPFVPFTVTDPAGCSDASTYFTYSIVYDPLFSSTKAHLSIDPSSSIIRVELGSGMSTS